MTTYRPELDATIARYRALLDKDDGDSLEVVELFGGIAALEYLAEGLTVHPDQRGALAQLLDDIARRRR